MALLRSARPICGALLALGVIASGVRAQVGPAPAVGLTDDEVRWVRQNPVVTLGCDYEWPPFEYLDEDGTYRGIASQFIARLAAALGLRFEVARDLTWSEVLARARARELDALPCLVRTAERGEYLDFTQAYVSVPLIVVMRDDAAPISGLGDLQLPGVALAVTKGYASEEWARRDYPHMDIVTVLNAEEGLRRVASGEIEAYLLNLATMAHVAPRLGLTNLRAAHTTEYSLDLRIGVPRGNPLLLSVLEKGLTAIPMPEREAIIEGWMESVRIEALAAPRQQEALIRLGVLANRGVEECLAKWQPTADYLSGAIAGYRFEIVPLGFEEVYSAAASDSVDLILANSAFYIGLEQRYGASPIATLKNVSLGGVHTYFGGVIFCRADRDDISSFRGLKGKAFMAVEETSLGGWLMAWRELKDHGIIPRKHFRKLEFGGTQDAVVFAVLHGDVDAGTVRTGQIEQLASEGKIRASDLRVLRNELIGSDPRLPFAHSTRAYPEWCFAKARKTSQRLADEISVALLRMAPRSEAAQAAGCAGWTAPLQYQEVRECLKELRVGPYVDYGKVSLREAVAQHWPWAAGILAFVVVLILFALYVSRLSRRIAESEERTRVAIESLTHPFYVVDVKDYSIVLKNSAAEALSASGASTCYALSHKAEAPCHGADDPCPLELVKATGKPAIVEHTHYDADGNMFIAEVHGYPVFDEAGNVIQMIEYSLDITARKEAEQELRKLSSAVRQSPATVVITDVEGRIEYANPKFAETTGYSVEEALGKNPRVLKSGLHPPEFYKDLWDTITSGEEWRGEFRNRRKDGSLYWESASVSPIRDSSGTITNFVAVKEDITVRKQMEEDLLAARIAADSANQAKSEFLSSMSHELRTPLNGVLGYVQVLQRDRTLTPRQRQSLASIKNCGEHLLALINDVLDLSKIEAGRMEIELAPCDFSHLIHSVADIIRQRAEGKGLELVVGVEPQVPRGIMADEKKLRQVLVNLLGNAVKFTDEGHIGLSVSEQGGKTITMAVSDTGMGISEEHIESIFDPFAQSEGGKTAGGTGLGLAISVRMVEGMGGKLTVESELGQGSTFTVTLPLTEVEDEDLMAVESTGLGGDNPDLMLAPDQDVLVLVADDREANRDVLVQLMEAAGFRTVQAVNGREALEVMREHHPPIVLMDVRMPEMDGVTAVGIIRGDPGLKDAVVIAVSASVFPDSAERFRDAGFDDFIGKPLGAGELFRKLREHAGVQFTDIGALGPVQEPGGIEAAVLTPEEAQDLAAQIRTAAAMGDVSALTGLASGLESAGGGPAAYAGRIAELAGMFDFAGLNALADEIESSSSEQG